MKIFFILLCFVNINSSYSIMMLDQMQSDCTSKSESSGGFIIYKRGEGFPIINFLLAYFTSKEVSESSGGSSSVSQSLSSQSAESLRKEVELKTCKR